MHNFPKQMKIFSALVLSLILVSAFAPSASAATKSKQPKNAGRSLPATINTILSGNGTPSASLGKDGDFYIDVRNSLFFGPKTKGRWTLPVSLVGPSGPVGAIGVAGKSGGKGEDGAPGANATGSIGSQGPIGAVVHFRDPNWPARRTAEDVALVRIYVRLKRVARAERVVVVLVPGVAVKFVRAGFGGGVRHPAHHPAKFGRVVVRLNLELL